MTPVGARDFIKTFDLPGDFASMHAALDWCAYQGISVGHRQRGAPCGLLFGDFDIQKWRNLRERERDGLHGYAEGTRDGAWRVVIFHEYVGRLQKEAA